MVVDASAMTAILVEEAEAPELLARIQAHVSRVTSPLAVWETSVAVARSLKIDLALAFSEVHEFLNLASIKVVDLPAQSSVLAVEAFARFGKGRHPAALNFGDCFIYALAVHLRQPLLYKGDDFARTDITPA